MHCRQATVLLPLALLRWCSWTACLQLLIYSIPFAVLETAEGVLYPYPPRPYCSGILLFQRRLPLHLWAAASTSAEHHRHHTHYYKRPELSDLLGTRNLKGKK
jgi:hypothetical protein